MPMFDMPQHAPQEYPTEAAGNELDGHYDETMLACFLASARCGCFMQAARSLNLSAPVLRKKLARLEAQLGVALFVNRDHTVLLTRLGRQLKQALETRRGLGVGEGGAGPVIRLAISAPLQHDLLGRSLVAFIRQHAGVRLELLDDAQADSDLALCLAADGVHCPSLPFVCDGHPDCLALLDYLPHIAKRYCREANRPTSVAALEDFMLVQWQGDMQVPALAPWQQLLAARKGGVTELASYPMFVQLIRCSACIGVLPHYAAQCDRSLLPLPGVLPVMRRGVWLALNQGSAQAPLVQRLAELIRSAFVERQAWFGLPG